VTKDVSFILPIKAVGEVNRNLKDDGDVVFVPGPSQVMFDINKATYFLTPQGSMAIATQSDIRMGRADG